MKCKITLVPLYWLDLMDFYWKLISRGKHPKIIVTGFTLVRQVILVPEKYTDCGTYVLIPKDEMADIELPDMLTTVVNID